MSTFKELAKKNRSFRGYDRSIKQTKEQLLALIDHVRYMPAARNAQPLKYYLAYEEEVVKKIQGHTNWAGALTEMTLPFEGEEPTSFIVILHDTEIQPVVSQFQHDVGIAAATITLAATEANLGCCMIGAYSAVGVKEVMGLPDTLVPVLVIAIGKPIENIVLTDAIDGEITYYRDSDNVHYVPKRKLADIICE